MAPDPTAAILDDIATLEVERARIESTISARMLEFADLRRRESECEPDKRVAKLEASFAADELSLVLSCPTMTVQRRLAQARRVRGRLPRVWIACHEGRLDQYRAGLIDEALQRLHNPQSIHELNEKVVPYAGAHTPVQLKAWLRRFIARVEPDNVKKRNKIELANRSVQADHGPDGVSWIHALVPSVEATRIDTLLTKLAKDCAAGDERTMDQRRADLFADLLLGRIDTSRTPTGRSHSGAVIGVTIPLTSLAGLDETPGESADRRFMLPAGLVRELAAEPGTLFHRLLTDPRGRILDDTEIGRFPSAKLRTALEIRDGTCAFPTCNVPAIACDKDHVRAAPRGPTSGANVKNLCRRHHRMKTAGIVDTTMDGARHRWRMPDGSVHASESAPVSITRRRTAVSRFEFDVATFVVEGAG